ncbi:MAG TPA: Ig-like domain-containing protein [Phycisphaerae bacterium]|nr:Ig-like domain-containing protein [Phycisphaerae bacterium]
MCKRTRSAPRALIESLESRVLLTVTPTPVLMGLQPSSDTGESASDRVTSYNNADADHALLFAVQNSNHADIYLYIDGVLAGFTPSTAVHNDRVTTDGHTLLADGAHTVTVRAQIAGEDLSDPSSPQQIVIETHASVLGTQDILFANNSLLALSTLSEITAILPLASGKILVGSSLAGGVHPVVARLNADGTLDTSFGSQGFAVLSGQGPVRSLALQSNGSILAGLADPTQALARLTAGGQLDTSFATNGYVLENGFDVTSIHVLSNGNILAGFNAGVLQLSANGQPDTTFGPFGTFFDQNPGDHALQNVVGVALTSDGHIYVASNGDNGPTTLRLNADGSLDTSFADSGYLTLPTDPSTTTNIGAIAVDSAGHLLIASYLVINTNTLASDAAFVSRFNADGSLDTSFGTAGAVALPTNIAPLSITFIDFAADGTPLVNVNGNLYHLSDVGVLDTNFLSAYAPDGAVPLADSTTPSAPAAFLADGSIVATNNFPDTAYYLTRILTSPAQLAPILLTPATDTGTPGDNITSIATPTISLNFLSHLHMQLYEGSTLITTIDRNTFGFPDPDITYTFSQLSAGTHHFTIDYLDPAGNVAPDAYNFDITIQTDTPSVSSVTASLAASASSLVAGSPVTLTATLSASGSLPDGSLIFLDSGVFLGTAALSNGHASLTLHPALGIHHYTAIFAAAPGYTSALSNELAVTATTNRAPMGVLSTISPSGIRGWAYDADVPAAAEFLRIDINGKPVAYLNAGIDLDNIPLANHGFSYTPALHAFGTYLVQLYAYNFPSAATPTAVLIATGKLSHLPPVMVIQAANAKGAIGWAYDPDAPSADLLLDVLVDGKANIIVNASQSRLGTPSIGGGPHAFTLSLPSLSPGAHRITFYVFNSANVLSGSQTITIIA